MKSKALPILIAGGIAALAAALAVRGFTDQGRSADLPYVRPEAAQAYTDFANKVAVDPPGAKKALEAAEKAAPENAFHDFLRAVLFAVNQDFVKAAEALKEGVAKPKVAVYTASPMPAPMEAVPALRKLAAKPEDLKDLSDEEAVAYLEAVRDAGLHMTQIDPIDSLSAVHIVSVVRGAQASLVALAEARKLDSDEPSARLKELVEWEKKFKDAVKPQNAILRVAEVAKVDQQIVSDYMAKVEIKDRSVLEKIERANDQVYREELKAVRDALRTMPGAKAKTGSPKKAA